MPVETVQTKREIAAMLAESGIRPRKRYGQHFLIDGNLMRRLVESAEVEPQDRVLEVGPGTGGLTDLLARRAARLLLVEIDRDLLAIVEDRFRGIPDVSFLEGDVLDGKHRVRVDRTSDGVAKLVANLPYQVATPLILNLLMDHPTVRRMCFTVQAEVGQRLTSGPGCKAFGPLAIVTALLGRVTTVARIPPDAFWPRPSVHSVMLRLDVGPSPFQDRAELHRFSALVRGAFDHRRKIVRAALSYVTDAAAVERACQVVDAGCRPEAIPPAQWLELFRAAECHDGGAAR
jgi:16S rRNA (adenine1518-N6/adenine1519-N6)-dimethyltransferase